MRQTSLRQTSLHATALAAALVFFLAPAAGSSFLAPGPTAALAVQGQGSVYDGQTDMTEEELLRFTKDLPEFRRFMKSSGESAHPAITGGKPDFTWSDGAAAWVHGRGWEPRRFFVVMGRTAAALVLVSEGEAVRKNYRDMPEVSDHERQLVLKHLGEVLKAGADPGSRQETD